MKESTQIAAVAAVSAAMLGFLFWLIYGRPDHVGSEAAGSSLPAFNALANLLCMVCLVGGYRAIRAGRRRLHVGLMLAAVAFSALFLGGYILHHSTAGDTPFAGQGLVRPIYFAVLISHIVVTTITLPMILLTLARAASGRFDDHRRIARRTLPLWLYVSATGVLIFLFLRLWS